MARLRDSFPERRGDPTWRARTYLDRRVGMPDPAAERRRTEQALVAARSDRGPAVRTQGSRPSPQSAAQDRVYRAALAEAGTDSFHVKMRATDLGTVMGRVVVVADPATVVGADAAARVASLEAILADLGIVA